MASAALLVSTAVMGVLLVGAALAVSRLQKRDDYQPSFGVDSDGPFVESDAFAFGLAAVVVAVVGAAVALDDPGLVFLVVAPGLLVAYFAWGVYAVARGRGFPRAHAVGLSTWVFGVLLVFGVALQLVFG